MLSLMNIRTCPVLPPDIKPERVNTVDTIVPGNPLGPVCPV